MLRESQGNLCNRHDLIMMMTHPKDTYNHTLVKSLFWSLDFDFYAPRTLSWDFYPNISNDMFFSLHQVNAASHSLLIPFCTIFRPVSSLLLFYYVYVFSISTEIFFYFPLMYTASKWYFHVILHIIHCCFYNWYVFQPSLGLSFI